MTDSQTTPRKTDKGMLRREWTSLLTHSQVAGLTRIHCPGNAGVHGNEQAFPTVEKTPTQDVLKLGQVGHLEEMLWTNCSEMKTWNERLIHTSEDEGTGG